MLESLRLVQTSAEAVEHCVPSPTMPAGGLIGKLHMDQAQVGETVAGVVELHGDDAGHAAGVRGNPGENEAARRIDFQVFTGVFDHAAVALHHEETPPPDVK